MMMQRFQRWESAKLRTWQTLQRLGIAGGALAAVAFGLASWPTALAQTAGGRAQPVIVQSINDGNLFGLAGNTRPEARNAANDRGRVDDAMPMPHLMLQLRRPAAQEQALATLLDQLHDPNAPNYHRWLTANDIGAQFGPAAADISTVTNWLTQHGFTVNTVYPNGMAIEFSGTAGQVRSAFRTEIHNLSVNGTTHFANTTDPQIPAALAPLVVGVTSLNDFRPRPQVMHKPQATGNFTQSGNYFVGGADLATIYNFHQAFFNNITGKGQTIYLVEDSDIYTAGGAVDDWTTFRTGFGIASLDSFQNASLTTIHPNCTDPGVNGDDAEAIIDAEYASAAAPAAAIVMAVCNDFVGMLQFMFNNPQTYPPAIMSISYGQCEAVNGAANNAAFRNIYQTGVAEGWSIFVSAGDQGAGGCDSGQTVTSGVGVNGLASTVYNVAVGGTDFGDTYQNDNPGFWRANNLSGFESALSYIPEIPWNTTCASQLFATYAGFATTYGASGLCNSSLIINQNPFYLQNWGGSGGQSLCAQGTPSVSGVISGSCTGWPKPSWQSGLVGNPADAVRDLPDVSMFASFGPWNHAYAICFSDTANQGTTCDGTANGWSTGWGGTSFGSPIWAGIQALINQYTGSIQGNPNPVLYKLAAAEYGASGSSACNSSSVNANFNSCIFYDVTAGDMVTPCTNNPNTGNYYSCYRPSGTYGVMSTDNNSYAPAFAAGTGWDFATGIGTVNVYNLVTNWATPGGGNAGLTVTIVAGNGTVTSNPPGINCPSTCSHAFAGGSQVTLTATGASGWSLGGWAGVCSGVGSCTVTMNAAESVRAIFVNNPLMIVSVSGSGTVTSSPAGINCPSTCSTNYPFDTQVTLTATPANGWGFSGWSNNACDSGGGVGNCVVTMNTNRSATATFAPPQYTLNVSLAGNGTVTSSPSGVSCPSVCTMNYSSGTPVTLTATPAGGATFNGWGGACSGNGSCLVTMNSLESVTAMFSASGGGGPSTQTFVSATLGSDSNPCTRISPCLTFAVALAQTNAGGEIDVLDPGDFGPVTITKAVSISYDADSVAGTVPSSGTSGIVISAGSSDVINLRGLSFDGVNASGTSGVVFLSGARLNISKCVFQGFTTSGMTLSPGAGSATTTRLVVQNTTILNNATGILIQPTGGIVANVTLRWLHIDNNTGEGLRVDGTGGSGAINAALADSTASLNAGNGIDAVSGPGNATVDVMRVIAASNGSAGIQSNQSSGGTASVTVGSSMLRANAIGIQATGGAGLLSYGNNQMTGNASNGSFTGTASLH
jgi:hypothetical protein